jgi:uncharacterized protein involved in exopolysaccharide biosynthesis
MSPPDHNAELGQAVADDGEGEGLDFEALKEMAGFVFRAPRRRPILATTVFVAVAGLGLVVAATIPRTYNVEVKLQLLPALGDPSRPREADQPMRNVTNVVMRHENLVSLVQEANLVERFYSTRPQLLRMRDNLLELVSGPRSEAEKVQGMVGTLETKLHVFPIDDSTVMISVDWNNPQTAYDLATLVQKHFFEARYDSEVNMVRDAIAVLEDHATTEHEQVESALDEYQKAHAEHAGTSAAAAPSAVTYAPTRNAAPAPSASVASAPAPDPSLTAELEDKRREIRALEEERQRELGNLKQQLSQAQLTLTSMHPTVIALQQKIDALSQPSPKVEQLKSEERTLLAKIAAAMAAPAPKEATGGMGSPAVPAAPRSGPVRPAAPLGGALSAREDPALAPAREKLESAIHRYQDEMSHIDSKKLELDMAKKSFDYRYSVINPAEVPHGPKKPIGTIVGLGSLVGALVAAILGCGAVDWIRGRVLEAWQVRRRCKLEVLGEIEWPISK